MDYVLVTPAKNEEKHIERTLQSVMSQTVKPRIWVIVDDGSYDDTPTIVESYLGKHEYLRLVTRDSVYEKRSGGSKVVRAFYTGYDIVRNEPHDIVVKLDADLTLPSNYFEEVVRCFESNPKIGLCGGYCVIEENGKYVKECYSEDHVRGAFKAYRRKCFDDMGGIKEIWAWDGIDEAAIRFHGWELKVLPLPVIHHRPTSKEYNLLKHSFKTGREMYKERVDLISLFVISFVHAFRKPVVIGSMLYIFGYIVSWMKKENKIIEKELGDYIRNDRYNKIWKKLYGKVPKG